MMAVVMAVLIFGTPVLARPIPSHEFNFGDEVEIMEFSSVVFSFNPPAIMVPLSGDMNDFDAWFAMEVAPGTVITLESVQEDTTGVSFTTMSWTPITTMFQDGAIVQDTVVIPNEGTYSMWASWMGYYGGATFNFYIVVTGEATQPQPTPAPTPTPIPTPQPTPPPATSGVSVTIDGVAQSFEVAPRIINNRTMLPLRAIAEALGMEVDHERATNTAILTIDDITVTHVIGTNEITVNGETSTFDVASMVVENRTLVPVRMLAEAIGADVEWEPSTRTAVIITN